MPAEVRLLGARDREALERFLAASPHVTMFMRSNLRAAGIEYDGRACSAQYVAALEDGEIVAVAAFCWNDNLIVHAPRYMEELVTGAVAIARRSVAGLLGPWSQIAAARQVLGLGDAPTTMNSPDDLFTLDLADLIVPALLAPGAAQARIACRPATLADAGVLTDQRVRYSIETLGMPPDAPWLRERCRDEIERSLERGDAWLLEDRGQPVACSFFNARLPDSVQIGGVYTEPALRGRGYGRAVVAGSLVAARAEGVRHAVLFTGKSNGAAQAAYRALGFRIEGEYGLILFAR